MSGWIETVRASVNHWEIDNTEHFTVAYYFARLGDAAFAMLEALGLSPTQALTITVDDPAAPDEFTIEPAGTTCASGQTLAAQASCTITIRFAPATAGDRSATLRVHDRATMTVALTGTGTES